jgi:hypothetical protein
MVPMDKDSNQPEVDLSVALGDTSADDAIPAEKTVGIPVGDVLPEAPSTYQDWGLNSNIMRAVEEGVITEHSEDHDMVLHYEINRLDNPESRNGCKEVPSPSAVVLDKPQASPQVDDSKGKPRSRSKKSKKPDDYGFSPGGRWGALLRGTSTQGPVYFEVDSPPIMETPNGSVFLRVKYWDSGARRYGPSVGMVSLDNLAYLEIRNLEGQPVSTATSTRERYLYTR